MKKVCYTAVLALALSLCGLSPFNMNLILPLQAQTGMDQRPNEVSEPAAVIYKRNCASCHDRALMGAPKPGDRRFQEPIDILVMNAINGIGNMPARGHATSLSEDEIRVIIEYMALP